MGEYVDITSAAHLLSVSGRIRTKMEQFSTEVGNKVTNIASHEEPIFATSDDYTTDFRKNYDPNRAVLIGAPGEEGAAPPADGKGVTFVQALTGTGPALLDVLDSALLNMQDQDGRDGDGITKAGSQTGA